MNQKPTVPFQKALSINPIILPKHLYGMSELFCISFWGLINHAGPEAHCLLAPTIIRRNSCSCARHCSEGFTHITSSNPHGEANSVITLLIQVRKRRQREVKKPAQGHTALDRGLNAGKLAPWSMLLSTIILNHEERSQTLRLPFMRRLASPAIFTPLRSVLLRTPIHKGSNQRCAVSYGGKAL